MSGAPGGFNPAPRVVAPVTARAAAAPVVRGAVSRSGTGVTFAAAPTTMAAPGTVKMVATRTSPLASVGTTALTRGITTVAAARALSGQDAPLQKHDQVEYYSVTLKQWVPAIIEDVQDGMVMINLKRGSWLSPEDIKAKIRRGLKESSPMGLRVGDHVEYYSTSMNKKLNVTVTAVSPTGDIMIDVKPGAWIDLEEQKAKITFPENSTHPKANIVPEAVTATVPRCKQGHPLMFVGATDDGWLCSVVNEGERCLSGLTCVGESSGIPHFKCKFVNCAYELCSACATARTAQERSNAVNPATCPKGHPMVNVGITSDGWVCDNAHHGACLSGQTEENQSGNTVRFRCRAGCTYDLCEMCFKANIPGADTLVLCPKLHGMVWKGSDDVGWICGASQELSGCKSGMTEPVQTPGEIARYWCKQCDFSLCEKCGAPRMRKATMKISAAGPKIDFKVKSSHEDPEPDPSSPKGSGDLPIGSIILDPENHLSDLPQQILHGKHQHPLKLKAATEANPLNIWKRLVVQGNTCNVCGQSGKTNYYRCIFDCKWYCCLDCAKNAAAYGIPGMTHGHAPIAGVEAMGKAKTLRLDDLPPLQKEFYKQLQKVVGGFSSDSDLGAMHPERIFKKFDTNGDRCMQRDELTNLVKYIYKNLSLPVPDDRLVDMIFDNCDIDEDGNIDYTEFPELYRRLVTRAVASFNVMSKDDLMKRAKGSFRSKYDLGKRLAAGVGGVTYIATNKASGTRVVVKKPFTAGATEDFDLLMDKSHPNIVRVFELFASQVETYIVMEFCGGGDLFGAVEHCFDTFGGITYNFIAGMLKQSMNGTNYLHMEFLECHNDLKPENVLLENKPRSINDVPRCMIADFGCVAASGGAGEGDPRYRAPELWPGRDGRRRGSSSPASDVWALGVMFFELLSGGKLPFINHRNLANWVSFTQYANGELVQRLIKAMQTPGSQPDYNEIAAAGHYAVDLCRGMLAYDAGRRVKLRVAMQHPYFEVLNAEAQPLPKDLGEVLKKRGSTSALKIALLNFVASKMQGESLDHFQNMWNQFDIKNEGVLREEAFIQMLQDKLEISEAKAYDIFSLADVDSNGSVDFNEFVAVMFDPSSLNSEQLESHLKGVFYGIADDKGMLDFKTFVGLFPEQNSRTVLQQVFSEMDKDGDGAVEWEEFRRCVQEM